MKTTSTILALCATFGALPLAASAADYDDTARVLSVTPQVEQINRPRQECKTEYVRVERQVNAAPQNNGSRNAGGAILGGVAGAILGNQVGGGNGRTAATAAGAIAGALVGDRIENNGNNSNSGGSYTTTTEEPVKTCRTVDHWETRNNGYAVNYDYHGRQYTTVLPYDPGKWLKVRVSVVPTN